MKKVGIVMFQNMTYAPFLKMYQSILEAINIEYDVIYYNRDASLNEVESDHFIPIKWIGRGTVAAPKVEKILNFFCFYPRFVKKVLNHGNYDFIIVLTTFPAVLLSGYLQKKYSKKYLIDIRDYTQESFKPYFFIESKVFSNASLKIISSTGYENFLPTSDYVLCHNIDSAITETNIKPFRKKKNGRILISYIGSISYEKQCIQLIELVRADDRFEFHFYGNEANGRIVSEYVQNAGNERIVMHGPFQPSEKASIYDHSDLVFNCYGNERTLVKYAISNKYYDGAAYGKPLLVTPNTSMADLSGKYAFELDLETTVNLDDLFNWYMKLNEKDFDHYAKNVIRSAFKDNSEAREMIIKAILYS